MSSLFSRHLLYLNLGKSLINLKNNLYINNIIDVKTHSINRKLLTTFVNKDIHLSKNKSLVVNNRHNNLILNRNFGSFEDNFDSESDEYNEEEVSPNTQDFGSKEMFELNVEITSLTNSNILHNSGFANVSRLPAANKSGSAFDQKTKEELNCVITSKNPDFVQHRDPLLRIPEYVYMRGIAKEHIQRQFREYTIQKTFTKDKSLTLMKKLFDIIDEQNNNNCSEKTVDEFVNTLLTNIGLNELPLELELKPPLYLIKNVQKVGSEPDFAISADNFIYITIENKQSFAHKLKNSEIQTIGEALAALTHNYKRCLQLNLDFANYNTVYAIRVVGTKFSFYSLRTDPNYINRLVWVVPSRDVLQVFKYGSNQESLGYDFADEQQRRFILDTVEIIVNRILCQL